jgi:hypothetical protein
MPARSRYVAYDERAMFQPKRNVDVVSPELRSTFKAQQPARR